jgi:FkbM family methyltransferase
VLPLRPLTPANLPEVLEALRLPEAPNEGRVWVGGFDLEYRHPSAFASTLELLFHDHIYDLETLSEPQTIIDGGAWLGLSVLRFRQLFPGARIVAFEPDPQAFQTLAANLEQNQAGDVKLVNAALWRATGTSQFVATGTDAGSLVTAGAGHLIEVPTVRLSDYVDGPVSLLKLNIEGSEWDVIDELGERLRLIDQVLIEYHGFAKLPQTLHLILQALDASGFTYILSHFNARNRQCVPPLRLTPGYRYFLLVYGRRIQAI